MTDHPVRFSCAHNAIDHLYVKFFTHCVCILSRYQTAERLHSSGEHAVEFKGVLDFNYVVEGVFMAVASRKTNPKDQ